MGVKSTGQDTAEGTNAAGDEVEATSAREADSTIAELVSRARAAMSIFKHYDQERANEVVQAVAWAIIKRENAEELARLAVEDTGLGKYEDKVNRNRRKSPGTLRDLLDPTARSIGIIEVDEEKGITKSAKSVGVHCAAVTPSTNPAATPANTTMTSFAALAEQVGVNLVLNQFRGIVTNAEADPETVGRLSDGCAAVREAPDFTEFQEQNFSTPESYQDAEEFTEYIRTQADTVAELQNEFGITGQ